MWNDIADNSALQCFMNRMCFFHDSCIKEMKYLSGAFVDDDLSMYPINNQRRLNVIIQRQSKEDSLVELEFQGLKVLKLIPLDDQYTCEIFDSTLILKDNCVFWCDYGGLSETDLENYDGTLVCASKLRWRSVNGCMGPKEFFVSIV